jgi:DNA-binding NarL/FixJ family response regulator
MENEKPTKLPHWSEWPNRQHRWLARMIADIGEQYDRSVPRRRPDPLLCFMADFQTPAGLPRHLREVLVMTAFGSTGQQIADWLCVKRKTVYAYRNAIGRGLDCMCTRVTARKLIGLPPRQQRRAPRSRQSVLHEELSARERDVRVGVNFGYTSKEIAEILGISFRMVGVYRTSIRRTLGMAPGASLRFPAS